MNQTFHGHEVQPGQLFINNEFVEASAGGRFTTSCPSTGEVITDIAEGTAPDIDAAVAAARAALAGTWGSMPAARRGQLLSRVADLIEERIDRLAVIETLDQGKPITESSKADIPLAARIVRYFAGWADKITGDVLPVAGNYHTYTHRQPVGVVGQIIPWNFPILIACWKMAPALAAGNTIVLKPAEQTPLTALELAKIFRDAGFPPGVVNVVTGDGPGAGASLVAHPGVNKIAFTGSTAVGQEIMRRSADTLKRVSLELGGKSPNIVFEDADLTSAVFGAIGGIFYNKGEVCAAGSRLFVQRSIHAAFMEQLKAATAKRLVDDPFNPKTRVGPQVSAEQQARILGYIEQGKAEGARLVAGGEAAQVNGRGWFVQPTIFDEVDNGMVIAQEEIFGPVLSVIPFDDAEDVVRKANATIYGLAAGIWTKDIKLAHRTARAIEAGTVWINCYNVFDPMGPFGGFKMSGFGRDLGRDALDDYTEVKTVWVDLN